MFYMIRSDIHRCYVCEGVVSASVLQKIFTLFFAYGLHAIIVYRVGKYADSLGTKYLSIPKWFISALYCAMKFYVRAFYGIHINKRAKIGEGLYIGHFGGIFIHPCTIGDNCSIHQQVEVGTALNTLSSAGPDIGNNVWIGANAKIADGIVIEDNGTVVVGAIVKKNVKARYLVMGNPARVVNKKYDNSSLIGLI